MARTTEYKGFIFIKGYEPSAKKLEKVEYKKRFSFNSKIQTLGYVQDKLIEKAKNLGGNAIIYFKPCRKFFSKVKSFLFKSENNIKWYGSGMAAILPEEKIEEILDRFE